jgi:tetratricopeptide (TPR) repeat protein
MLHLLIGSDYALEHQYDKAHVYLQRALELSDSLKDNTRSQILCAIGDTYYQEAKTDSAFTYYEQSIDADPGNLLALNNCAYYLACEGQDLDRAERMAAMVVKERTDDATSLDTYAWVFFKKSNYTLAKRYIDEAIENLEEPSAEVYHHAGDIYFMGGDPDKALEYWKQALELESDNELLQRKVRNKAYYYK